MTFASSIIPYQVMTGNYSRYRYLGPVVYIIPYQVMTGNYSDDCRGRKKLKIIPYQVMTGNYSVFLVDTAIYASYHTK